MTFPTKHQALIKWVEECAALCGPDRIVWCDGSESEKERLIDEAVKSGEVERLDPQAWPGCLYARSAENDVARVEQLTFICTRTQKDAGPTNNWMDPQEAYRKLGAIFDGAMKGRTMYVVPYIMGLPGSRFSKIGIELTDSIYVVLNMRIMAHMGKVALDELGERGEFNKGLHSKATLDDKRRFICHFPEDNAIWSVGSNYGGNVLLGKKCLALRIGSWLGRKEGWLAEHMLVMGIQNPQGKTHYVAAAFPSQCGKTNLAMLVPPPWFQGWKVTIIGDDLAWMRIGEDGRLWAVNPEAGFFGVAPGTNSRTNPNAIATIRKNTIFTNVLKTDAGGVWWEGMDGPAPSGINWRGRRWPAEDLAERAAHPNSRFTAPVRQCPSVSPAIDDPRGVPISAIIFGGRRARTAPLVYQSRSWQHGVYVGATLASETTAAATGQVGVVRRDPMAMLPFCGYNMGDYFRHWLEMGKKMKSPPKIFHINWFRKNSQGNVLWPGFGENLRVLEWILKRAEDAVGADEIPLGFVPRPEDIHLEGLALSRHTLKSELLNVDKKDWMEEVESQNEFFQKIGDTLPAELRQEQEELLRRFA